MRRNFRTNNHGQRLPARWPGPAQQSPVRTDELNPGWVAMLWPVLPAMLAIRATRDLSAEMSNTPATGREP